MKKIVILILIAFMTVQCAKQSKVDHQRDIEKIEQNAQKFSSYVNSSNYKMIAESYTKDAKIFPQRGKIINGVDGILKYWTLPEGVKTINHKITPNEITIVEDTAYDYGYYEGTTIRPNGDKSSWEGKYVIVWKRVGDDWKMYLDIWNSI